MESGSFNHLSDKNQYSPKKHTTMETRKSVKADLERKRPVFFQLGLIVAISAALAAFEWRTPDRERIFIPRTTPDETIPEVIRVVKEKKAELPKTANVTVLKIVDNTKDVSDIDISVEIDPAAYLEPFILPDPLPDEPDTDSSEPFAVVEQMPRFPGGEAALMKYLSDHLVYPLSARETGISGVVYIAFVVEPDGRITSEKVLREVPGGCTEEALRVIKSMPNWIPGMQRGKPVRVTINLPVRFVLR